MFDNIFGGLTLLSNSSGGILQGYLTLGIIAVMLEVKTTNYILL